MKFLSKRIRILTVAVAAVLVFGLAGTGIASAGNGGSGNNSSPVLYNSLTTPQPGGMGTWSVSFGGTNATAFGNKITLASSGQLSNVVVDMSSWACGTGGWSTDDCVTTPGTTYPVAITFSIYGAGVNGVPGSLITSDTQTFKIPFRPSASATCAASYPGEWFDAATGDCLNGYATPITFNNFSRASLPSVVVYGISYAATGNAASLNVEVSSDNEVTGAVTVGSDTDPGTVYASAGSGSNDLGGPTGELTCSAVGTAFVEYSTTVDGATGCGTTIQSTAPFSLVDLIPAVELNSGY